MIAVEVKDHPDYVITPDGRVYSRITHRFLEHEITSLGYHRVCLDGDKIYVGRLVAENYISNPDPDANKHVKFINGNKDDLRFTNLRWSK
ncbi:MAG: HNH endonuclease [Butyrivibrio sp.]|nr:HNH endonuclease [Butyrivibrio sp.]